MTTMRTINLNGKWRFQAVDAYGTLPKKMRKLTSQWLAGTVPGTVHTDLMANKKIPDPFFRMNENDLQWIDAQQWMYRRDFDVDEETLREDVIALVAEGLDTYATIRLNDNIVVETANMFVEHRFNVKQFLRAGKNTIEVLFDSPTIRSKALEKEHGGLRVALEPHRVYVRKAQYSFGWDWGPKLTTVGIWRNIALEAYSHAKLRNQFVKVVSANEEYAVIDVQSNIELRGNHSLRFQTIVRDGRNVIKEEVAVDDDTVHCHITIPSPQLWWPNGYGEQPIYTAQLFLLADETVVDTCEVACAIRTVRLIREKDEEGESFIIEINGEKIFCKGADWIPSDSFIPRIPDSTYETLLTMAKNAHMNMIRVWGGGIYEQDIFYNLCDKLGLMVWQDFMYACGAYPEGEWFVKQAKEEAAKVVARLRNHPSIVVWCGNNECEWLFCTENPDKVADDMSGARIFRDILPLVVAELDGTRPYWRSSPFGEGFPNAELNGNHHQWSVWSAWKDYKEYENDNARFITEFGFQAPANRKTFEEVTIAADRHPQSPAMEHHNKQVEGTERLVRFQAAHYKLSERFDDFVYQGQLVQAEALKYAVEHWRRRKFETAGSLFWQLNDCWQVSSWSVIDSSLRPKAGYYFSRKFFAPVLLSFKRVDNMLEVWVTNDLLNQVSGKLELSFRSFVGKKLWRQELVLQSNANTSRRVVEIPLSQFMRYDTTQHFFYGRLLTADNLSSEQRYFLCEPKHLTLPKPKLTWELQKGGERLYTLVLHADGFVKNVRVEIENEDILFDDNYFDMNAGETKELQFDTSQKLAQLRRHVKIRWL